MNVTALREDRARKGYTQRQVAEALVGRFQNSVSEEVRNSQVNSET